jgi:site-specific recombinase XerD
MIIRITEVDFMFNSKPNNVQEAVSMLLFLWNNTNARTNYGDCSLVRGLKDFSSQCGNIKLTDTKELQAAINNFFNHEKVSLITYNERCYALHSFFNWLTEKGYTDKDLSRNYSPVG